MDSVEEAILWLALAQFVAGICQYSFCRCVGDGCATVWRSTLQELGASLAALIGIGSFFLATGLRAVSFHWGKPEQDHESTNVFTNRNILAFLLGKFAYHCLMMIALKVSHSTQRIGILPIQPAARLLFAVHLAAGVAVVSLLKQLNIPAPFATCMALFAAIAAGAAGQGTVHKIRSMLPQSPQECASTAWWRFPVVVISLVILPAALVGRLLGFLWVKVLSVLWGTVRVPVLLCTGRRTGFRAAVGTWHEESGVPLLQLWGLLLGYLTIAALCMVSSDAALPEMASVGVILWCAASFTCWSAPVAIDTLASDPVTEKGSASSRGRLLEGAGDGELGVAMQMAEWGVPWSEHRRQMYEMDLQIQQQCKVIAELRAAAQHDASLRASLEEDKNMLDSVAADRLEMVGTCEKQIQNLEKVLSDSIVAHEDQLSELRASIVCDKDAHVDALQQQLAVARFKLDTTEHELEKLKCELETARAQLDVECSEKTMLNDQIAKLESELQGRDAHCAMLKAAGMEQCTDAEALQRFGGEGLDLLLGLPSLSSGTCEHTDPAGDVETCSTTDQCLWGASLGEPLIASQSTGHSPSSSNLLD